jgi:hypothetical protein
MDTNKFLFCKRKRYLHKFLQLIFKHPDFKLHRNNLECLLEVLITKPPRAYIPQAIGHSIQLPNFKEKDTNYNYYLSDSSVGVIEQWLYKHFWAEYDRFMICVPRGLVKHMTFIFLETYNLDLKMFDMLVKHRNRNHKRKSKKSARIIASFRPVMSFSKTKNLQFNSI